MQFLEILHALFIVKSQLLTMSTVKWNKEPHSPGRETAKNLIIVGNSLWYSSSDGTIDIYSNNTIHGMTEYCMQSHKILQTIPYPAKIKPYRHCCCLVKNIIYIIIKELQKGSIIAFNPDTKKFAKKLTIPEIGDCHNVIVMGHKIRIFHGQNNDNHDIIYDTINNSVEIKKGQDSLVDGASIAVYQNKIISIGGYGDGITFMDTVKISKELNDNEAIQWVQKPQWKLPQTLCFSDCVLFQHFILLFGGNNNRSYHDDIYLLDLRGDNKWNKLDHIKCPVAARYVALLAPDNMVHLFLGSNCNWPDKGKGHYTLPIFTIMRDSYNTEFDLGLLKFIDSRTRYIVYGYFRDKTRDIMHIIPNEVIDICLVYFFA